MRSAGDSRSITPPVSQALVERLVCRGPVGLGRIGSTGVETAADSLVRRRDVDHDEGHAEFGSQRPGMPPPVRVEERGVENHAMPGGQEFAGEREQAFVGACAGVGVVEGDSAWATEWGQGNEGGHGGFAPKPTHC